MKMVGVVGLGGREGGRDGEGRDEGTLRGESWKQERDSMSYESRGPISARGPLSRVEHLAHKTEPTRTGEQSSRTLNIEARPWSLDIYHQRAGKGTRLEGDAGRVVHRVEGERAQVREGLAGAGEAGGGAAGDGRDEVRGEGEAAVDDDGGGDGAAGVDHAAERLLRKEGKGVSLRRHKSTPANGRDAIEFVRPQMNRVRKAQDVVGSVMYKRKCKQPFRSSAERMRQSTLPWTAAESTHT